ncbi:hypothetical protein QCA50_016326 [Cerrena zonata]|uniref:Uncharacterized protein n=1 Tax=Cerrena zonata TaxID=2478898 RepID=A0AAW0FUY5_9APHY
MLCLFLAASAPRCRRSPYHLKLPFLQDYGVLQLLVSYEYRLCKLSGKLSYTTSSELPDVTDHLEHRRVRPTEWRFCTSTPPYDIQPICTFCQLAFLCCSFSELGLSAPKPISDSDRARFQLLIMNAIEHPFEYSEWNILGGRPRNQTPLVVLHNSSKLHKYLHRLGIRHRDRGPNY